MADRAVFHVLDVDIRAWARGDKDVAAFRTVGGGVERSCHAVCILENFGSDLIDAILSELHLAGLGALSPVYFVCLDKRVVFVQPLTLSRCRRHEPVPFFLVRSIGQ